MQRFSSDAIGCVWHSEVSQKNPRLYEEHHESPVSCLALRLILMPAVPMPLWQLLVNRECRKELTASQIQGILFASSRLPHTRTFGYTFSKHLTALFQIGAGLRTDNSLAIVRPATGTSDHGLVIDVGKAYHMWVGWRYPMFTPDAISVLDQAFSMLGYEASGPPEVILTEATRDSASM